MDYQELNIDNIDNDREFRLLLEEWRNTYHTIYLSEINEIEFIWRGLSRAEYRKAMEYYQDDFLRAEYVCRMCVLEPEVIDWDTEIPAGIPETLTQHILEESGFSEGSSKFKELKMMYDQEMSKFENQVSCVIKEVFNEFSIEEIDNWPIEKTMWYFSRARWTLRELRGINLQEEESPFPGIPNA